MQRLIFALLISFSLSSAAQITIENPSVRAMPPGQPNTAAFMVMHNTDKEVVRLVKLTTSIAKKAEFHSHKKDEKGVMRMRKEAHVEIAANDSFTFQSGGYHIMLIGLKQPLKAGDIVPLTLEDSNGNAYSFNLPVVSLVKKMDHSHHHHH